MRRRGRAPDEGSRPLAKHVDRNRYVTSRLTDGTVVIVNAAGRRVRFIQDRATGRRDVAAGKAGVDDLITE